MPPIRIAVRSDQNRPSVDGEFELGVGFEAVDLACGLEELQLAVAFIFFAAVKGVAIGFNLLGSELIAAGAGKHYPRYMV